MRLPPHRTQSSQQVPFDPSLFGDRRTMIETISRLNNEGVDFLVVHNWSDAKERLKLALVSITNVLERHGIHLNDGDNNGAPPPRQHQNNDEPVRRTANISTFISQVPFVNNDVFIRAANVATAPTNTVTGGENDNTMAVAAAVPPSLYTYEYALKLIPANDFNKGAENAYNDEEGDNDQDGHPQPHATTNTHGGYTEEQDQDHPLLIREAVVVLFNLGILHYRKGIVMMRAVEGTQHNVRRTMVVLRKALRFHEMAYHMIYLNPSLHQEISLPLPQHYLALLSSLDIAVTRRQEERENNSSLTIVNDFMILLAILNNIGRIHHLLGHVPGAVWFFQCLYVLITLYDARFAHQQQQGADGDTAGAHAAAAPPSVMQTSVRAGFLRNAQYFVEGRNNNDNNDDDNNRAEEQHSRGNNQEG